MRILLIMDPGLPVPPLHYGGHERLAYLFAEEYTRLGHEVTLLAGPESHCSGTVVSFGTNDLGRGKREIYLELGYVWQYLFRKHKQFDLVHNFGRLAYLLPVLNKNIMKIMTYGRPVSQRGIKLINALPNKNLRFTACSDYCVSTGNIAGKWHTVYNAIKFDNYHLTQNLPADAPLIFLGRLDRIKGAHTAIRVAKATGNRLIIAGNIPSSATGSAYFRDEIAPFCDGEQIVYLGPLNDSEKDTHLGRAKALLFPIEWEEPFGIVMIEAMACGTPVIGFKRGSVPEVVEQGVTGIQVDDAEGMILALDKIKDIDRACCREQACARFDVRSVAGHYLSLFNCA
jgi:glycosyltransferase involved in cell wall biosynthesis